MMKVFWVLGMLALAQPAFAADVIVTPYEGSFDDASFALENAILNKGLVLADVLHAGEMLNRTGEDVGDGSEIFKAADIFLFCSAVLSREAMKVDPMNIVYCPYNIFVVEGADGVQIGYDDYPDGPMDAVENLLGEIVADAVDE